MKITASKLRQIISEELEATKVLHEGSAGKDAAEKLMTVIMNDEYLKLKITSGQFGPDDLKVLVDKLAEM